MLKVLAGSVQEKSVKLVDRWKHLISQGKNRIQIDNEMQKATLDVISKASFSYGLGLIEVSLVVYVYYPHFSNQSSLLNFFFEYDKTQCLGCVETIGKKYQGYLPGKLLEISLFMQTHEGDSDLLADKINLFMESIAGLYMDGLNLWKYFDTPPKRNLISSIRSLENIEQKVVTERIAG